MASQSNNYVFDISHVDLEELSSVLHALYKYNPTAYDKLHNMVEDHKHDTDDEWGEGNIFEPPSAWTIQRDAAWDLCQQILDTMRAIHPAADEAAYRWLLTEASTFAPLAAEYAHQLYLDDNADRQGPTWTFLRQFLEDGYIEEVWHASMLCTLHEAKTGAYASSRKHTYDFDAAADTAHCNAVSRRHLWNY